MVRFYRIATFVACAILILWDFNTISDMFAGQLDIDAAVLILVPCNLFFGVSVILKNTEKKAAKPFFLITMVFALLHGILRLVVVVESIIGMTKGQIATESGEYLVLAEFLGYALLMAAVIFFGLYSIKNILKKTTAIVFGLAVLTLVIGWVIIISGDISEFNALGGGKIGDFWSGYMSIGIVKAWVTLFSYIIIYINGLKLVE